MYLSPEYFIEKWAGPCPTPAGLKRRQWSFLAIHAPFLVLYEIKRPFWGASTYIYAQKGCQYKLIPSKVGVYFYRGPRKGCGLPQRTIDAF